MKCPVCNTENRESARFCTNCARSLAAAPAAEPPPPLQYPTMRGRPELKPYRAGSDQAWLAFLPPFWHFYHGEFGKGLFVLVLYAVGVGLDLTIFGAPVGFLILLGAVIWAVRDARKAQAIREERR